VGWGLSLPFNNAVWLFAILFIGISFFDACDRGAWVKLGNVLIQFFLILSLILPLVWSPESSNQGIMRFFAIVLGMMFFISLFSSFTHEKEKTLILIIVASGFIQAIWGTAQIFLLDEGLPHGIFQQTNVMASYLLTTLLASFLLLRQIFWHEDQSLRKALIVVSFFAFLVGIVIITLKSRTIYLCLLIALYPQCIFP